MKMNLRELIRYSSKFNYMEFNKERAVKLAKLFMKFGFLDKKTYAHFGEKQMFNWEIGDGTLFHPVAGKVEIGKEYEGLKGWFIADFD